MASLFGGFPIYRCKYNSYTKAVDTLNLPNEVSLVRPLERDESPPTPPSFLVLCCIAGPIVAKAPSLVSSFLQASAIGASLGLAACARGAQSLASSLREEPTLCGRKNKKNGKDSCRANTLGEGNQYFPGRRQGSRAVAARAAQARGARRAKGILFLHFFSSCWVERTSLSAATLEVLRSPAFLAKTSNRTSGFFIFSRRASPFWNFRILLALFIIARATLGSFRPQACASPFSSTRAEPIPAPPSSRTLSFAITRESSPPKLSTPSLAPWSVPVGVHGDSGGQVPLTPICALPPRPSRDESTSVPLDVGTARSSLAFERLEVLLTAARAVPIKRLPEARPPLGGTGRLGTSFVGRCTAVVVLESPHQPSVSSGGGERKRSSSKRAPPFTFRRPSTSSSTYFAESSAA